MATLKPGVKGREIDRWITINGMHVPVYKGESGDDAVGRVQKLTQRKAELQKSNNANTEETKSDFNSDEYKKFEKQFMKESGEDVWNMSLERYNKLKQDAMQAYKSQQTKPSTKEDFIVNVDIQKMEDRKQKAHEEYIKRRNARNKKHYAIVSEAARNMSNTPRTYEEAKKQYDEAKKKLGY